MWHLCKFLKVSFTRPSTTSIHGRDWSFDKLVHKCTPLKEGNLLLLTLADCVLFYKHAHVISSRFLCPVLPKDVSALYVIKTFWRWVPVRWTARVFRTHKMQLGLPLQLGSCLRCIRAVLNAWSSAWSFVVWCLPFQVAKYWLLSRATRSIRPHASHYFSFHGWTSPGQWQISPKFWLGAFGRLLSVHKLNCFKFTMFESCLSCKVIFCSIRFFFLMVSTCQYQLQWIRWKSNWT